MANRSFSQALKEMPREYYILSALLFLFFVSWAGCYSLLAIWLQRFFNLTGQETGFTYAVFSVTAFCLQPFYGFIQDKLVLRKNLIAYLGVLLSLCGPYYIFVCEPLLRSSVVIGGISVGVYMGLAYQAGIGVLESYAEKFGRRANFEFGHVKMWGALGWAVTVAITGILININPHYNFWLSTVAGIVFLILLKTLKIGKWLDADQRGHVTTDKVTLAGALSLTKIPAFWALVFYVFGSSVYLVYDQQFMVFFSHQFEDEAQGAELYGYLNSAQVFLESFCTFLAPFIVNKIGAKRGLILAGLIMFARIGLSGIVEGPVQISIVKLLHAPEVPLVVISFFKYITTRFDALLSATLYLVGYQMITQVIGAILAPLAGYGYDTYGFETTYIVMSIIVLVMTVIAMFTLKGMSIKEEEQIRNSQLKGE